MINKQKYTMIIISDQIKQVSEVNQPLTRDGATNADKTFPMHMLILQTYRAYILN